MNIHRVNTIQIKCNNLQSFKNRGRHGTRECNQEEKGDKAEQMSREDKYRIGQKFAR